MEQHRCRPGEPGPWSPSLGSRAGAPDLLHHPHRQILGERKRIQRREKPDVAILSSLQLAGAVGEDLLRLWSRGLELWLAAVALSPVRASGTQPGGEERFHVQLEPQRESGGRHDLITSAGPGPRPPSFRHLSVARDAGGVLIGIIHKPLGGVLSMQCPGVLGWGGILGSFVVFPESR